jgi:hypothetical protein
MADRSQLIEIGKQLAGVAATFVPGGPAALALGEKVIGLVSDVLDQSDEPAMTDDERTTLRAAVSSKAQHTADRLEGNGG